MQDIFDAIKGETINGSAVGEKAIKNQLKQAALYLAELIRDKLNEYYVSHPNARYRRTGRLMSSIVTDNTVSVEITPTGNTFYTYVHFNENALHRSGYGVWPETKGKGIYNESSHSFEDNVMNTALAVNYGYSVKSPVWFKDIPKFGQREGAYFVEKAIDEFNKTNKFGIFIDKSTDIIIT